MGKCLISGGSGGLQMELLWTNANLSIAFPEQTVSLDLTTYSLVGIKIKTTTDQERFSSIFIINKNSNGELFFHSTYGSICGRYFSNVSNTGITFGYGYYSNNTKDNTYGLPYQIYGIK